MEQAMKASLNMQFSKRISWGCKLSSSSEACQVVVGVYHDHKEK